MTCCRPTLRFPGGVLLTALLLSSSVTSAQEPAAPAASSTEPEADAQPDTIDRFRTSVDRLAEHYLGSTSRPVRFDWRRSPVIVAVQASELIERNNFGSFRLGGTVRRAFSSFLVDASASYVFVVGTESSDILALTPYRQPGRPSRIELDVNVGYPLFEGVVTPLIDFIPPAQMVLSATAGARYLLYTETVVGDRDWRSAETWTSLDTWTAIGQGLATAQLLDDDKARLERDALGGMAIDPATVHTLVGLTFDTYLQPGFFLSSRAMLAVPLLAPLSGTRLGLWWELGLAAGWAF